MDIQEIARLHSRYGEAPLTIEMPVEERSMPMLGGPVGTGTSEPKPMWSRLTEAQRLVIALIAVAGFAFPIGMMAASAGKQGGEPSVAKTQSAIAPVTGASAAEGQGHEWPPKTQADVGTELAESLPARAQAESQPAPAAAPSAASVSAVAPAGASTAASKPVAKAPPAPAKSPAAVTPGSIPSGQAARAVPQATEARRSNEIKLF